MAFGLPQKEKTHQDDFELNQYGSIEDFSMNSVSRVFLAKSFKEKRETKIYSFKFNYKKIDKFIEKIKEEQFVALVSKKSFLKDERRDKGEINIWHKKNALLYFISTKHNDTVGLDFFFFDYDEHLFVSFVDFLKELSLSYENKGAGIEREVYVLGKSQTSFFLNELPRKIKDKFIPEHYNIELHDKFELIKTELAKSNPSGRLVVMTGVPGSGKTHLVKSIIGELESKYVFIPPNLLPNLSDPDLISALIDNSDDGWIGVDQNGDPIYGETSAKSIVLIIEDADMALVDRDKYKDKVNLACMSNILNFSDGIIGSLIDVRIIVTTNYLKKDLDKAILRNGRLLTCIECNYISYEQCETIWNKNIDKFKFYAQEELDKLITREYTLANIYELINFCKREGRMKNEQDKD